MADEQWNLHEAARAGRAAEVAALLDAGAALQAPGPYRRTALMVAAQGGDRATVGLLIGRGADVDALDENGSSTLHQAAWSGALCCAADSGGGRGQIGLRAHARRRCRLERPRRDGGAAPRARRRYEGTAAEWRDCPDAGGAHMRWNSYPPVEPHIERVGLHHKGYGIGAQDLDNFRDVFLEVLEEECGDQWTPECRAAWKAAFDELIIPSIAMGMHGGH